MRIHAWRLCVAQMHQTGNVAITCAMRGITTLTLAIAHWGQVLMDHVRTAVTVAIKKSAWTGADNGMTSMNPGPWIALKLSVDLPHMLLLLVCVNE